VGAGPADVEAKSSDAVGELLEEDPLARMISNYSMIAVATLRYRAKRICWVRWKLATVVASVTRRASHVVRVASVLLELVLSEQQE
jgi:hypothetical protein